MSDITLTLFCGLKKSYILLSDDCVQKKDIPRSGYETIRDAKSQKVEGYVSATEE